MLKELYGKFFNRKCKQCQQWDYDSAGHKCCDKMWDYNDKVKNDKDKGDE
jgi:hypothetical protein